MKEKERREGKTRCSIKAGEMDVFACFLFRTTVVATFFCPKTQTLLLQPSLVFFCTFAGFAYVVQGGQRGARENVSHSPWHRGVFSSMRVVGTLPRSPRCGVGDSARSATRPLRCSALHVMLFLLALVLVLQQQAHAQTQPAACPPATAHIALLCRSALGAGCEAQEVSFLGTIAEANAMIAGVADAASFNLTIVGTSWRPRTNVEIANTVHNLLERDRSLFTTNTSAFSASTPPLSLNGNGNGSGSSSRPPAPHVIVGMSSMEDCTSLGDALFAAQGESPTPFFSVAVGSPRLADRRLYPSHFR